jgi:hypothetical protein
MERGNKPAEFDGGDAARCRRFTVFVGEILGERCEILAVALDRMQRSTALNAKVLQELSEFAVHGGAGGEGTRVRERTSWYFLSLTPDP